jgi:hypothetical protein
MVACTRTSLGDLRGTELSFLCISRWAFLYGIAWCPPSLTLSASTPKALCPRDRRDFWRHGCMHLLEEEEQSNVIGVRAHVGFNFFCPMLSS